MGIRHILLAIALTLKAVHGLQQFQQQLIKKHTHTDLLQSPFTSHVGEFRVLDLPKLCSYELLDGCHLNTKDQDLYYEYCFSDVCKKENYYCIDGNGLTIHICGIMPRCKIRYRYVAEYDTANPDTVQVYSVLCPDGYVQLSIGNCFNQCWKDQLIVVIRNTTSQHHAVAHCNTKDGKCNPRGVNVFYLDSQDDICEDPDKPCDDTKDFLPDCSCVEGCPEGQVRSLSSEFLCVQIAETAASSQPSTKTTSQPNSSLVPPATDSYNSYRYKGSNSSTVVIVLVVFACVIGLLGIAFVVFFYTRVYHRVPVEEEERNIGNRQTPSNENRKGDNVNISKEKRINETSTTISSKRDVNMTYNVYCQPEGVNSHDCSKRDTRANSVYLTDGVGPQDYIPEEICHEQKMNELKEQSFQNIESGMGSSENMFPKQVI